jgi:hypothetical protein
VDREFTGELRPYTRAVLEGTELHRLAILAAALLAGLCAACGGPTISDVPGFLSQAKATIDQTQSLHFNLTSDNAQGPGIILTAADGDAKRPNAFSGTLHVNDAGLPLQVGIVSLGGQFYAELPFHSSYEKAKPEDYGFGDPAQLLDPNTGLSSLLSLAKSPALSDQKRLSGENLQLVTCTLPGDRIAALLVSADPSRDVKATFWINPDTHQTREVDLVGPFASKDHDTTYHLVLTNFGENVTVTAPAS